MDIRQLRTFVHIAELGTFSKASERLRIAQPALSRQIRLLEAELKAKLFVRHGRGVSLTSAGELLLDRAASIIRQIEQTRADVAAEAGEISGHVSLGLPPSVGFLLTGPLVEDMRTAFPKVTLKVVEGIGGFVHEWMVGGRLDIGVLFDPKSSRHLEISPLWSEDLHLVGPGSAGLSLTEPVHLAELSKYSLILPSAGHGLRGLLERYTTRHEVELSVEVEADAMRIQKDLVIRGLGYTVLPYAPVDQDVREGRLSAAAISSPAVPRRLVLAYPANKPVSRAARMLGDRLIKVVAGMAKAGDWPGLVPDFPDLLG